MDNKPRIMVVSLPVDEFVTQIPYVNLDSLKEILTEAQKNKPDLVLLPQYAAGSSDKNCFNETTDVIRRFSIKNSCYVVYNYLETIGQKSYCVSRIMSRKGENTGEYRKTHRIEGIDPDISLGDDTPVFDLDFGRVALIAGTDIYIPELSEIYSLKGAEILLCSLGMEPLRDDTQVHRVLKARAIANYYYVAASTYASVKKSYMGNNFVLHNIDTEDEYKNVNSSFNSNGMGRITGRATIYDLRGEILASTGRESGAAVSPINLDIKRNIKDYIYGPGAIVYHQNQRGIFNDITGDFPCYKREYPVKNPIISFVHMNYSDTIGIYSAGDLKDQNINYEKLFAYINRASVYSDLVICSELSAPGNYLDNELMDKYSECARVNHCYIAVNQEIGGVNTSVLFDRSGKVVLRYEKVNTLNMMYDKVLPAGSELPVVDLDFARVGFMVCADSYCPEIPRILALKGAEVILFQSQSWGYDANAINEGVIRSWAIENSIYIALCNFPSTQVIHRSSLVDPTGETIFASNYNMEDIYSVKLNLDAAVNKCSYVYKNDRITEDYHYKERIMAARRPHLYKMLTGIKE